MPGLFHFFSPHMFEGEINTYLKGLGGVIKWKVSRPIEEMPAILNKLTHTFSGFKSTPMQRHTHTHTQLPTLTRTHPPAHVPVLNKRTHTHFFWFQKPPMQRHTHPFFFFLKHTHTITLPHTHTPPCARTSLSGIPFFSSAAWGWLENA